MQNNIKRVLFIGDIVDEPGKNAISTYLARVVQKYRINLVVANGENITMGRGISKEDFRFLIDQNIDVVTLGNHTFTRRQVMDVIDDPRMVRPCNLVTEHGHGFTIISKDGLNFLIISAICQIYMNSVYDNPVKAIEKILQEQDMDQIDFILLDIHGQLSAEKYAIMHYFAGKITAILGTHTHIPTADAHVFKGTAFQSDVGMTGCYYHAIKGHAPIGALTKLLPWVEWYERDQRCQSVDNRINTMCGSIVFFCTKSKKAIAIKPVVYGSTLYGSSK